MKVDQETLMQPLSRLLQNNLLRQDLIEKNRIIIEYSRAHLESAIMHSLAVKSFLESHNRRGSFIGRYD